MNSIYHWLIPAVWIVFWSYWLVSALNVKKARKSESRLARMVHLAFACFAFVLIVLSASPNRFVGWHLFSAQKDFFIGVAILLIGLGFAVWARIHLGAYWSGRVELKEGHRLIRTGPYKWVRHPIYTGILAGFLGTGFATGDVRIAGAFVFLGIIFFLKSRREECLLTQEFGDEYIQYRKKVPAFLPFLV
ncbi:MAG TPA: isoprenylcysteine carboxylmethyltransferase family protein [Verrucomicrobiae bacterium]|nr:isoprenylcysteine carboxylmethyltransferase family protein [Verrucomicrobiae bacterium]